jgi:hypothetical protein
MNLNWNNHGDRGGGGGGGETGRTGVGEMRTCLLNFKTLSTNRLLLRRGRMNAL